MSLTARELWGVMHGMVLGGLFLLAFTGGMALLYDMQQRWLTREGLKHETGLIRLTTAIMAISSWLTVISGTYLVYPWYRARPPEGADLRNFPRAFLKADPDLSAWHSFGMEWKEHVTWFTPLLTTAVAFIAFRYGRQLATHSQLRMIMLRMIMMMLLTLSFLIAAIAGGLFGTLITKIAPIL